MEILNTGIVKKEARPVKVIQFGEGNFLRGFVDYMLDIANEKKLFHGAVVMVKPIEYGSLDDFHQQDCLYTVSLRGLVDGEARVVNRVVTSIADAIDPYLEYERYARLAGSEDLRFVVSNTTEAGITYDESDRMEFCPPRTYPGKLTKFLYERYTCFHGDTSKGLIILPVELIDDNGAILRQTVWKLAKLWGLEDAFTAWLADSCVFASTLVDRIITGFPGNEAQKLWEEFGYRDNLIVAGEPFALWVIESGKDLGAELPLAAAGLPVIFTDDQKPYRQRKVRILNGAHTSFALASFLAGNDYVLESMEDEQVAGFMRKTIYDEVIPTLKLPEKELVSFGEEVEARFKNPYIKHSLLSISLNSVSKWKARCMPSFLDYIEKSGSLPSHLTFSLAALMAFYTGNEIREKALVGHRGEETYRILDDPEVLEFFAEYSTGDITEFVMKLLSKEAFWGQDLTRVGGLPAAVAGYLTEIRALGMRGAMKGLD